MTKITHIAALAALGASLAASLAGPALAGDSDLQTLQQDSGRYIGSTAQPNGYRSLKAAQNRLPQAVEAGHDVQLDGR